MSDVKLITAGDKVGASEATLLAKLGIKPFEYGLVVQKVSHCPTMFLTHIFSASLITARDKLSRCEWEPL